MSAQTSPITRQRILLGVALVILLVAVLLSWRAVRSGPNTRIASDRAFMCAKCGKVFEHTIKVGEIEPIECESCGEKAAWIPEQCYWTKDGKAKREPTYVILKQHMGIDEKTFCPDCGREVVGHNRRPPKKLMDEAAAQPDK